MWCDFGRAMNRNRNRYVYLSRWNWKHPACPDWTWSRCFFQCFHSPVQHVPLSSYPVVPIKSNLFSVYINTVLLLACYRTNLVVRIWPSYNWAWNLGFWVWSAWARPSYNLFCANSVHLNRWRNTTSLASTRLCRLSLLVHARCQKFRCSRRNKSKPSSLLAPWSVL